MKSKRNFYVEIDIMHEDSSYEIVGIFSEFEDFLNAYNETKEKLNGADSISTVAGDTINDETNEVIGMIFNDNVEEQIVDKSFWNGTINSVKQFYEPWEKEPPILITKIRGHKKNNMSLYRYVCDTCHKEPKDCKCQYHYRYSLSPNQSSASEDNEDCDNFKFAYSNENYSYVCPYCYHDIDGCVCNEIPLFIVSIESWSETLIRKFREKGYLVIYAGASSEYNEKENACIKFRLATKYKFEKKPPKGWEYDSAAFLSYSLKSNNTKDLILERDEMIEKLVGWIDSLEVHSEWLQVESHADTVSI